MAQRIRRQDLVDGIIDSSKIENYAIDVSKIKTLDTGDGTGINAETLPFGHGFSTPSIADKINALIAGSDWTITTITATGTQTDYPIWLHLDTTAPYLVFFNGQLLKSTYDYTFTYVAPYTHIVMNWTPESNKDIVILGQLV